MNFSNANVKDVVKTFRKINMHNTSLCLSEQAPAGLCLMNPEYLIVSQKLEPDYGYEFLDRGFCIDGRILGATDFAYGKFRPPGESEYADIRCYNHYGGSVDKKISALKELAAERSAATEVVDISAAFDAGEYQVAGSNLAKLDIRRQSSSVSVKKGAQVLIFDTEEDPKKLFTVSLELMRGLNDLGFKLKGYVLEGKEYPVILIESELLGAVGVLTESPKSGARVAPDGREISLDAVDASWWSEEKALSAVQQEIFYFRPVRYGTEVRDLLVEDVLHHATSNLAKAVSALRWRGYPDYQLSKILKDREYEAWLDIHSEILRRAKEKLDAALNSSINVPYLLNQTKQLCGEFEDLKRVMESRGATAELDYGPLTELVEVVNTL